jgi:hypothetical protein
VALAGIDDYMREKPLTRRDVVKIDIDGAELDVFRGMQEALSTCPPTIIPCELVLFSGEARPGASAHFARPRQLFRRGDGLSWATKGYEARALGATDGLIPDVLRPESIEHLAQNLINVAFVRGPDLKRARPELFCA